MAATSIFSGSSVGHDRRVVSHIRTYNWPPWQLNFWILVMLLASCTIVGVFAVFVQMQGQLGLPVPWYDPDARCTSCSSSVDINVSCRYFPYYITVGCLAILYIGGLFWLIATRRLLPAIVMIGAFMLFVMWLVGLVVVSIQLWGPNGSVQGNCNAYVFSQSPTGKTLDTLAWMQQRNICQSWQLVFAMGLTGAVFLVWVMIMAYQVFVNS
ncbi:arginase-like protein [Ophiocordyceps sinensis CO18]|uniref:Arginase-like protein n=1 Tax=Ophiocordyceps sinensis (strain Co18 / CGMCC 3.14243) TaxID=911162 RepID=T5A364_OPHSC|nr:arginase-like protein [Ophiocordyceps sinensis CO18]